MIWEIGWALGWLLVVAVIFEVTIGWRKIVMEVLAPWLALVLVVLLFGATGLALAHVIFWLLGMIER